EAIERELLLIKVAAPPDRRAEMMALAEHYKARVADLGPEEILFELVGLPEEVEAFEELLRPYGIKESARTGRVGLGRAFAKKSTPVKT
ncbi:MAG: acetolactate synthase small subunit, partial [Gaiellaceae bacterium]|nr:acetolactate synthase small subunit [Gaiellaceae bacterium]